MKNTSNGIHGEIKVRAGISRRTVAPTVLGSIPGLERFLPGHYRPGGTVHSKYGTWILPRTYKGRRLCAIIDGSMIG
jgi:hypothetical protein